MPTIKLKGTSALKENVSQNATKEPKKKKKWVEILAHSSLYHISFDIGS